MSMNQRMKLTIWNIWIRYQKNRLRKRCVGMETVRDRNRVI